MDPHLKRLQDEINAALSGLSIAQLHWHPSGKWGIAEILEHLYLTYTGTSKGLSRLLDSGKAPDTLPTWRQRAVAYLVVNLGYFPGGVQSPPVARPKGLLSEKIVSEIALKISEMDAIMTNCGARFGAETKVLEHPLLGPFSINQWRRFHLVHGLHHIKQIRRVRKQSKNK